MPIERPRQSTVVKENLPDAGPRGLRAKFIVFTAGAGAAWGDFGMCPICPLPVFHPGSV